MGDALRSIGEAALGAALGERVEMGRLRVLEALLERADLRLDAVSLEIAAETRSGARITRIRDRREGSDGPPVILKEGRTKKLRAERDAVLRWHEAMPGVAPRIIDSHEHGERSAILFEHIARPTFERLLLQGDPVELERALRRVQGTLTDVWTRTRDARPASPRFMDQLRSRLGEVFKVHPDFRGRDARSRGASRPSLERLVDAAIPLDDDLKAPFSVLIHGDFNVDNIILDAEQDRVRLVDLHRSRWMDYAQDVSVFLVSNARLLVIDAVRGRRRAVMLDFLRFARSFAELAGDRTFPARLALGLARSFATSTRFVLDEELSRSMWQRARRLLERVLDHDANHLTDFDLTEEVWLD